MDSEELADYYDFKGFDILILGRDISDMLMDPELPYLYLADYGNNALLRIDVGAQMAVDRELVLGSHPVALDLMRKKHQLVVAFNGESNLKIVDLDQFVVVDTLAVSLSEVNDVVCATISSSMFPARPSQTLSPFSFRAKR